MTRLLDSEPQSICVVRFSAIGDVCHAVSTVQAIQRYYPNTTITWVIGKIEYKLLRDLPGIEFIVFDKKQGFQAYQQLRRTLRGRQFDVLLHMQLALRANLAALCIRAKIKLGFAKERCKELHSLAVNQHITDSKGYHVLDGFRDFARAIGIPDSAPQWNFPLTKSTATWLEQNLPKKPYVVISPCASKPERNWLTEHYAAISDYCTNQGYEVIFCGSPSQFEADLLHAIEGFCQHKPINFVGKTSLPQLLGVLRNAACVIAPDSGPAHMAVTQGIPVVGLYAHSNPQRTGPYGNLEWIAEVYTDNACEELEVTSTEIPWGFRLKGADLMQEITVEQVQACLNKVLKLK